MDLFEYSKSSSKLDAEKKERILTVGQITTEIKQLIGAHFQGQATFWIKGEISGYKDRNQAGHMYFKLKDDTAVLSCAFFKFSNARCKVDLKEGLCVLARGKIDVYEKTGSYQLIIEEIRPEGDGDLYLRFEKLKKKLEEEGLFRSDHKVPLPKFPKVIGIVTSPTGAVVRDIIHVIRNRYPVIKILVFPVKVQGDGAAEDIVRAIDQAHRLTPAVDVLVVGRGGGSIEDLWCFNDERVVRAVHAAKIPVVSAVGHQTDFTLCDFVADVRAATPSHAAEMIVPNLAEVQAGLDQMMGHLVRELVHCRDFYREKLLRMTRSPILLNPRNLMYAKAQRLDFAREKFQTLSVNRIQHFRVRLDRSYSKYVSLLSAGFGREKARYEKAKSNLDLVSPLSVLARGFSIMERKGGQIVRDAGQVKTDEQVTVRLHRGVLECQILKN